MQRVKDYGGQKMKVITLSKVFMQNHPRAGQPTGFRNKVESGVKIHTLRANKNGYYKDGDVVSLREWEGRPYASKQVVIRDAVTIGVERVTLRRFGEFATVCGGGGSRKIAVHVIANNDGLYVDRFKRWMFGISYDDVSMSIIHFTPFRYCS